MDAETKLYIKEQADRARNQALGIFGLIAVLLTILEGLYIDSTIDQEEIDRLRRQAENDVKAIAKMKQNLRGARVGLIVSVPFNELTEKHDGCTQDNNPKSAGNLSSLYRASAAIAWCDENYDAAGGFIAGAGGSTVAVVCISGEL